MRFLEALIDCRREVRLTYVAKRDFAEEDAKGTLSQEIVDLLGVDEVLGVLRNEHVPATRGARTIEAVSCGYA
jgi:hypothetical protein